MADRLRRHADRAGRGELGDEDALFLRRDAGPALAALRNGGEGELGREVVGVDGGVDRGVGDGVGAGIDEGGEGREDFLRHGSAPLVH